MRVFCFLSLVALGAASPLLRNDDVVVEGDIHLTQEQADLLQQNVITNGSQPESTKNGAVDLKYRWPNKVLPYTILPGYSASKLSTMNKAISELAAGLAGCITITPRTDEENYVEIGKRGGCWSYVGYEADKKPQPVSLDDNCIWPGYEGITQHELMHALGLWHEQSRSDRDQYVNIHWENIKDGKAHNFNKYSASMISHYSQPYDYTSLMHYGGKAFSTNGQYTITRKDGGSNSVLGQRTGPSATDLNKLKIMYGCMSESSCAEPDKQGDGFCHDENNTAECEYDGGDCCGNSNPQWFEYCEECQCIDPEEQGCAVPYWKGDRFCDDENNNAGCDYDGGDCCNNDYYWWDYYCTVCNCFE